MKMKATKTLYNYPNKKFFIIVNKSLALKSYFEQA